MYTLVQTVCRLFTCGHEERKCWDDTCNLNLPLASPPALLRGAHLSRDMPPGPQRQPLTTWGSRDSDGVPGRPAGRLGRKGRGPQSPVRRSPGPKKAGPVGHEVPVTHGHTHTHTRLHRCMHIIQRPCKLCRPRSTSGSSGRVLTCRLRKRLWHFSPRTPKSLRRRLLPALKPRPKVRLAVMEVRA